MKKKIVVALVLVFVLVFVSGAKAESSAKSSVSFIVEEDDTAAMLVIDGAKFYIGTRNSDSVYMFKISFLHNMVWVNLMEKGKRRFFHLSDSEMVQLKAILDEYALKFDSTWHYGCEASAMYFF